MPKTQFSARNTRNNTASVKGFRKWAERQAEIIRALTCGKDRSHPVLSPKLEGNKIVLACLWPGCGYTRKDIPKILLSRIPAMTQTGVTVIISRSAWEALLKNEKVAVLRVFSKGELHHEFGDNPEEHIVKVKIIPVTA